MFTFASIRPRLSEWRGWLPLAALPTFMFVALLALGGDRGFFYREEGDQTWGTVKNLAIAENLSPERNFLLTLNVWLDEDGGERYEPYGRFPIGGYVFLKLALLPFGNDLAAKLMAARVLMLLMFCGAAAFAHLAMSRITGSRWVAAAAVLLAFSGFYALYYADAVHNEGVMDLFGAGLALHGMAVFIQEGRFRQLIVKVCAALLLGWHVYALLLPFIVLGFGGEAVALFRAAAASNAKAKAARSAITALVRSRYAALAAVSILFGCALLAFNFANEYMALTDGEPKRLSDLPSATSALCRLSVISDGCRSRDADLEWGGFARRQLYRAGVASIPYAVARAVGYEFRGWEPGDAALAPAVWGLAAACAALAALALARERRLPMAAAVLFGFCWAVIVRNNAVSNSQTYEAVHYLWLALALFALALMGARGLLGARLGGRAAIAAAALAAPIFALSVFYAGQGGEDAREAERQRAEMSEFDAIRETTRGKNVAVFLIHKSRDNHARHYLAGSYAKYYMRSGACEPDVEDFLVSGYRADIPSLLTPNNRFVFLYERLSPLELCREKRRRLESSAPAARSVFDVYLQDDALSYLKAPCEPSDYDAPFHSYSHPANPDDMPARFSHNSVRGPLVVGRRAATFDGACLVTLELPRYPIAAIQTGQRGYQDGESPWEVFITPPPSAEARAFYEKAYQAATSSGEPAARTDFDLYLDGDGDTLSYLKAPCGEDDTRGRFFLSVHPVDVADLPESRRALGHESLNFDFAPPAGIVFGGKCMATRRLPDYPTAFIETGRDAPGGERTWEVAISPPLDDEARALYEKAYQAIAESGAPAARSGFDLYLDGDGDTLSYLKAPCGEDDTRGRFFLSVHPVDVADLPESRRALGHESLNFDFSPPAGIVFGDKCMTTRQLPDYPIDRIATGQDAPGGERTWDAEIAVGD